MSTPNKHIHKLSVSLSSEQYKAVNAWRLANGVATVSDALNTLVKLGLLSEIRHIYFSAAAAGNHRHSFDLGQTPDDNDTKPSEPSSGPPHTDPAN